MKKVYPLLLLSLTFNCVVAQQVLTTELGNVFQPTNSYITEYNSPEGTPYLNKNFTPAKINAITETKFVRFNGYTGQIEVKADGSRVIVLDEAQAFVIKLLDGSDMVYETHEYVNEREQFKTSFFQLAHETDKFKLFVKEKIIFQKEQKAEAYKERVPPKFKDAKPDFYIEKKDENTTYLSWVPKKVNSFLKTFPDKGQDAKKFIKGNKLKLDRTEDLVKLFEFYFESSKG